MDKTLIMKKGSLKVYLYEDKTPVSEFDIFEGDVLTLLSGGHGFVGIEDYEMIEIKQGPFVGEKDKTRFDF